MRVIGRVIVAIIAIVVAWWLLGAVLGFVAGTLMLAFRLAVVAAVAAGAVWTYRRLSGGSRSRRTLDSSKSLDWQYLKGKVDRETYMRRKGG